VRAFPKYLLFQLPGWLLGVVALVWLWPRTGLATWIGVALLAAWVVKDFALYPLVRSAYVGRARTGGERLIGIRGKARDRLDPEGWVFVVGELWRARTTDGAVLEQGSDVVVVAADGLVLSVAPATRER